MNSTLMFMSVVYARLVCMGGQWQASTTATINVTKYKYNTFSKYINSTKPKNSSIFVIAKYTHNARHTHTPNVSKMKSMPLSIAVVLIAIVIAILSAV